MADDPNGFGKEQSGEYPIYMCPLMNDLTLPQ
jgi:hypothetical protein